MKTFEQFWNTGSPAPTIEPPVRPGRPGKSPLPSPPLPKPSTRPHPLRPTRPHTTPKPMAKKLSPSVQAFINARQNT